MRVVHEHAQHVHGPLGLFANSFGDPERVDHAVAVTPRRDLENLHQTGSSLREMSLADPCEQV